MATLSQQTIGFTGAAVTYSAAAGGGDNALPDPRAFLHVKNGGGSPINVTVTVPGSTFLQFNPDIVVAVPNGGERLIGPLLNDLADASTFGVVLFAYSAVTSVTVAVIRVGDLSPDLL